MAPRPPRAAERLLAWALGPQASTRAILGDLAEDFARVAERDGWRRARRWYWRESSALAVSALFGRLLGRRPPPRDRSDRGEVRAAASTSGVVQDARYALRAIRRDSGFFFFATAIIGLGVGATTAVFSVMSPLLLQPLPFEDPGRLVWVQNGGGGGGLSAVTSRTGNLRDFRERARSFEGLAGYDAFFEQDSYTLVGAGEPERLVGVGVTHDFLDVLGVEPLVGRDFTYEEGVWDGRPAVILTHGFWTRRLGADPGIVGRAVTLNDVPREVVGVLPPSFDFHSVFTPSTPVDFLLTWAVSDETDRSGNTTAIVGRLRAGVTPAIAQAELDRVLADLRAEEPDRWGLDAVDVSGLQEHIARPYRVGMLLLAAAAALVMLIVCVNLSNMLLARSPRRRREMAVRRTLGATRGRLVRQLLLESVLVSLCGAAVGVGLALAATRIVTGASGLEIPLLESVTVDRLALLFTVGVALLAGLGVGTVPALQVAEGGEARAMGGSSRGASAGRRSGRLRELLVVAEVAMACVLPVFGGLFLRSYRTVLDVDLGFGAAGTVAWQINPTRDFDGHASYVAFVEEIVGGVQAVPGIESVGLVDALPLGRIRSWSVRAVGVEYADGEVPAVFPHIVDHRYLETMGIPLVGGRDFSPDDRRDTAPVAIVNETAAREMFPDGSAVGRFLDLPWYGQPEVVGVAADIRHQGPELDPGNQVYFPYTQMGDFSTLDMVVRTRLPAATIAGPVGAAIQGVAPTMPTEDFWTMEYVVERSLSARRLTVQLLAAFAACALLLAALGIYGVLSYSVTERTHEIGIRMALGASASEVRSRLVGRTLVLAGVGITIGTVGSLGGTRLFASLLYGVEPTDPATFAVMISVLFAVAALSGLIPAIRASRTDSAGALRAQ